MFRGLDDQMSSLTEERTRLKQENDVLRREIGSLKFPDSVGGKFHVQVLWDPLQVQISKDQLDCLQRMAALSCGRVECVAVKVVDKIQQLHGDRYGFWCHCYTFDNQRAAVGLFNDIMRSPHVVKSRLTNDKLNLDDGKWDYVSRRGEQLSYYEVSSCGLSENRGKWSKLESLIAFVRTLRINGLTDEEIISVGVDIEEVVRLKIA
jgi:hypothetical protein